MPVREGKRQTICAQDRAASFFIHRRTLRAGGRRKSEFSVRSFISRSLESASGVHRFAVLQLRRETEIRRYERASRRAYRRTATELENQNDSEDRPRIECVRVRRRERERRERTASVRVVPVATENSGLPSELKPDTISVGVGYARCLSVVAVTVAAVEARTARCPRRHRSSVRCISVK